MTSECHNLDAYLDDDLPADAAAQFAQHIDDCEQCRQAIAQQRWIDSLLSSDACATVEPAPAELRDALHAEIPRRQTAHLIACGLASAATLAIVALGWTLKLNRQADGSREPAKAQVAAQSGPVNPESINARPSRATFVSNGDTIAVPLESTSDDVTIVQLYPTTETERRMRLELVLQLTDSESNGG